MITGAEDGEGEAYASLSFARANYARATYERAIYASATYASAAGGTRGIAKGSNCKIHR